MWIDSHCHLNHPRCEGQAPEDIVEEARAQGVHGLLNISCQVRGDFTQVLETACAHEGVWCTVGTHPHNAGDPAEQEVSLDDLVALAQSDPKIIGIGESGLDYHYDYAPRKAQEDSFRKHIRACIETDLPLVVHARDADEDIMRVIREEGKGTSLSGVLHCFSSGAGLAQAALDFGFYISFSGILTFKSSEALRGIARSVPRDRLLVETDAPFLAPAPHRGQTNTPAYVVHTGGVLADTHDCTPEEMARQTTENFYRLFTKAKPA